MKRPLWIVCLCVGVIAIAWPSAHGAEPPVAAAKPEAKAEPEPAWASGIIHNFPIHLFSSADLINREEGRKIAPGVKRLPQSQKFPIDERYDVTEIVAKELKGLKLPSAPDFEATYFPENRDLYFRGRPEDVWSLQTLFAPCLAGADAVQCRASLTLAEFDAVGDASDEAGLTYTELRNKAGASWRELQSQAVLVMSGQKATTSSVAKSPDLPAGARAKASSEYEGLLTHEVGLRAALELQVGPDGTTVQISYELHWRHGAGEPSVDLRSNSTMWEGHPMIVHLATAPTDPKAGARPARHRAMIMSIHTVNLGGWPSITKKQPGN